MFSNRRPYYGLKLSIADFFRESVRYIKQSNTQESMMEKPYLIDEYPKMHLSIPDFKFKPKKMPGFMGPIANGLAHGGLAIMDYGEAMCGWDIARTSRCIEGPVIITLVAEHFWTEEFKFTVQIVEDAIGVTLAQLPETEAFAFDEQNYLLTFPEDASGSVTICGFASTYTLVSQTFETVVAGMPVGIYMSGGGLMVGERGQTNPAVLLKSSYGEKGADCGCISFSSNCAPACECKNIGYTTQQMSTNEVQTLTVVDPDGGCTYEWSIASGGGSLSSPTGISVDYTAPGANEDCLENPTITLSVGGSVCDTLNIAVNEYTADPNYFAYRMVAHEQVSACSYAVKAYVYNCAGVKLGLWATCSSCSGSTLGTCPECCMDYYLDPPGCWGNWKCTPGEICTMDKAISLCESCADMTCAAGDTLDLRGAAHKEAGCCPADLL